MTFESVMERHKENMELVFMVIDRLTPETRAVIHEHGCPAIEQLIMVGVPGPAIVQLVEAWAKSMPVTSQPQCAAR